MEPEQPRHLNVPSDPYPNQSHAAQSWPGQSWSGQTLPGQGQPASAPQQSWSPQSGPQPQYAGGPQYGTHAVPPAGAPGELPVLPPNYGLGGPQAGPVGPQRKPNMLGSIIVMAFVALAGLVVALAGVSSLFADVEITYPQSEVCGSIAQPLSIVEDGEHSAEVLDQACQAARNDQLGESLIQLGLGTGLTALGTWGVVRGVRQRRSVR